MQIGPLLYLKNQKAQNAAASAPQPWFQEDPVRLAKNWQENGAEFIYIHDLNVPATGKSENVGAVHALQTATRLPVVLSGNFRSIDAIAPYIQTGVSYVVIGAPAYQTPDFFKTACKTFPGKIVVQIELKNGKVVIPGWIAPSHKTALDYAERFQEEGAAAITYSELSSLNSFCGKTTVPIWYGGDLNSIKEIEYIIGIQKNPPRFVVLGKSLYEGHTDLHAATAYLKDLEVKMSQEETLVPEEES